MKSNVCLYIWKKFGGGFGVLDTHIHILRFLYTERKKSSLQMADFSISLA